MGGIIALNGKEAFMKKTWLGVAVACVVLASGLLGCSKEPEPVRKEARIKAGIVQQAPWMDGEHWGMSSAELRILLGKAPELESKTSDYYPGTFDGRPALAQYVFRKEREDAERTLERKIIYLAHPKRAAILPAMSLEEAETAFGTLRTSVERVLGKSTVVTQQMAVSANLESLARVVGDRVKTAEKEVRAVERQIETKRKELQRQYAGKKNKNAMVASGLVEFDKPLHQAQRKLMAAQGELNQVRQDIRRECEALPEEERPFHWESNWSAKDGTASLYLTVNSRGTHLALSFEALE